MLIPTEYEAQLDLREALEIILLVGGVIEGWMACSIFGVHVRRAAARWRRSRARRREIDRAPRKIDE